MTVLELSGDRWWAVVGCALVSVVVGLGLIRLGVSRGHAVGSSVLIGCGLALLVAGVVL